MSKQYHWYLIRSSFRSRFDETKLDERFKKLFSSFLDAVTPVREKPEPYQSNAAKLFKEYEDACRKKHLAYEASIAENKKNRQSYMERNRELKSLAQATREGVLHQLFPTPEPIRYPSLRDESVFVDDWEGELLTAMRAEEAQKDAYDERMKEYEEYLATIKEKRTGYQLKSADFTSLNNQFFPNRAAFEHPLKTLLPEGIEEDFSRWRDGYVQRDLIFRAILDLANFTEFEEVCIHGEIVFTHQFKSFGATYRLLLHDLGGKQWMVVQQNGKAPRDKDEGEYSSSDATDLYEHQYDNSGEDHERWYSTFWESADAQGVIEQIVTFLQNQDVAPVSLQKARYLVRRAISEQGIPLEGIRTLP